MRRFELVRIPLFVTMAIDPAFSDNPGSDKTAITVVGNTPKDHWLVMEAEETPNNKPTTVISRVVFYALRYRPNVISIEGVGGAQLYQDLINPRLKEIKLPPLVLFYPGTKKSKEQRILKLEPRMRDGRLSIRRGLTALHNQFSNFPQIDHDDLLDSLSQHLKYSRPASEADLQYPFYEDEFDEDDSPRKSNGCHVGRSTPRAA